MDTIRESPLGQLLRAVTGSRILLYPEEKPRFVLPANLEEKGQPIESDQSLSDSPITPAPTPYSPPGANSEREHTQDETNNIVGWYGPDDPLNPRNWSSWKKRLVTFQIWYNHLTFYLFMQHFV